MVPQELVVPTIRQWPESSPTPLRLEESSNLWVGTKGMRDLWILVINDHPLHSYLATLAYLGKLWDKLQSWFAEAS